MSLKYLNNTSWSQTTREERFFCLQLYMNVTRDGHVSHFIDVINKLCETNFKKNENWELGYEVCFYRDFRHEQKDRVPLLSPKRTFDLCLMSDKNIVIIEAKCAERFKPDQIKDFIADHDHFRRLGEIVPELKDVKVSFLGLVAQKYAEEIGTLDSAWLFENGAFDRAYHFMTWEALADEYDDPILRRGGAIFNSEKVSFDKYNTGGSLTGLELEKALQNGLDFWVGRKGGLQGIAEDIEDGIWLDSAKTYQTNTDKRNTPPSNNWFRLSQLNTYLR